MGYHAFCVNGSIVPGYAEVVRRRFVVGLLGRKSKFEATAAIDIALARIQEINIEVMAYVVDGVCHGSDGV